MKTIEKLFFFLWLSPFLLAAPSPEQWTQNIAKKLHPIPNQTWKKIAKEHLEIPYEIQKGDTLSQISKTLFGNSHYWPKIWALNHQNITNPHLIYPDMKLIFSSGDFSSLPSLTIRSRAKKHTSEWKKLPKQKWESVSLSLPPKYDPYGFLPNDQLHFAQPNSYVLPAFVTSEPMLFLGEITASRNENTFLALGDIVYIQANEELQIGETYTITQDATDLRARVSDRKGYAYPILGTVRLIDVRDNLFIGMILNAQKPSLRKAKIVPYVAPIYFPKLHAAPTPIEGVLFFTRSLYSAFYTAQHKYSFIDRGSEDGIEPGMVFRVYQHYDPATNKKITDQHFIIEADLVVFQVSPMFSLVYTIRSFHPVLEHSRAVLITDPQEIKSLLNPKQPFPKALSQTIDDLDQLNQGGPLLPEQIRTLRQLEQWQKTHPKETKTSALPPSAPPVSVAPQPSPPEETTSTEETLENVPSSPETSSPQTPSTQTPSVSVSTPSEESQTASAPTVSLEPTVPVPEEQTTPSGPPQPETLENVPSE